jgi:DNA-binding IclR family transcriptional regulator
MANDKPDAIGKGLEALLLLRSHSSMRVTDISAQLGIAPSTAHRILASLRSYDFVEQVPGTRRYRLGEAALTLTQGGPPNQSLAQVANRRLEQLRDDVNETVNLIILDGPDALFIDGIEGRDRVRIATRIGERVPAYATAGGKALLATMPDERISARYPDGLERLTPTTLPDLAALLDDLRGVRDRGWATNLGESVSEVSAVGAVVRNAYGTPVAGVTISVLHGRYDADTLRQLVPRVLETAGLITTDLELHAGVAS